MADHGTRLVNTDGVDQVEVELPDAHHYYRPKVQAGRAHRHRGRRWANQHGARMAVINDTNHARMDMEVEALVDGGWSPVEALRALTVRGAEPPGCDGDLGMVAEGQLADVIAVDGDPLRDVCILRRVSFLMKDDEVVRPLI